jgi:hypothetical protein
MDHLSELGTITNRNADGPIVLTLPDAPPAGASYIIHQVKPYPITVQGQPQDALHAAGVVGGAIRLNAPGSALELTYTSPHFWSGLGGGALSEG